MNIFQPYICPYGVKSLQGERKVDLYIKSKVSFRWTQCLKYGSKKVNLHKMAIDQSYSVEHFEMD